MKTILEQKGHKETRFKNFLKNQKKKNSKRFLPKNATTTI